MVETGKVLNTDGDIAEISVIPGDGCRSCPASAACGMKNGMRIIRVRNPIKAEPGDIVSIEIANKSGLGAAVVLFGLPIMLVVAGLIISAGWSEIYQILTTVGGLIFGLVIAKVIDRLIRNRRNFMPAIIDKKP